MMTLYTIAFVVCILSAAVAIFFENSWFSAAGWIAASLLAADVIINLL